MLPKTCVYVEVQTQRKLSPTTVQFL